MKIIFLFKNIRNIKLECFFADKYHIKVVGGMELHTLFTVSCAYAPGKDNAYVKYHPTFQILTL